MHKHGLYFYSTSRYNTTLVYMLNNYYSFALLKPIDKNRLDLDHMPLEDDIFIGKYAHNLLTSLYLDMCIEVN